MKRQAWYPSRIAEQVTWHGHFAESVKPYAVTDLEFDAAEVDEIVKDALWLEYVLGDWLSAVRGFSAGATGYLEQALSGDAGTMPVFTAPVLPPAAPPLPAVVVRPPGGLNRIFTFVQRMKDKKPAYTVAKGLEIGIEGTADTTDHPTPKFSLKVEQGAGCQCVNIPVTKYTHEGVVVESRRANGAWEQIGLTTARVFEDERPLLNATQPEVREYRLRYWDKGIANGPWSEVQKCTVAP